MNDCSSYKTCNTCLSSNNPYCGWCLFGNKCTSRTECTTNKTWLFNTNNSSCPFIKSIDYNNKIHSIGSPIYLSPLNNNLFKLSLSFKLEPSYKFICLLVDTKTNKSIDETRSTIDLKNNLIICEFNAITKSLTDNSNDLDIDIKFKLPHSNEIITFTANDSTTNFKFIYINCMNRVSCCICLNENSCKWDSSGLNCVPVNRTLNDDEDSLVIDNKSKCLKYNILKLNQNFTYNQQLMANTNYIDFEIINFNTNYFNLYSIWCQFNDTYQVVANLIEKQINSAKYQCSYLPKNDQQLSSKQIEQFVYLNIAAISQANKNRQNLIDNLNEIKLNVVNCELASNCGYCLQNYLLDINCGWCLTNSKCTTSENCASNRLDWLAKLDNNEYADCPSPIITNIEPNCGPVTGGTQLSIYGVNLGHNSNEISVNLFNGKDNFIKCHVNSTLYIKSAKIICTLEDLGIKFKPNSDFDLLININTTRYSKNITTIDNSHSIKYKLILPIIESIEPNKTIASGGTKLKVRGNNLHCGSIKQIYFGDKICEIILNS